jgi:uncharacterized membrane-anchored protein
MLTAAAAGTAVLAIAVVLAVAVVVATPSASGTMMYTVTTFLMRTTRQLAHCRLVLLLAVQCNIKHLVQHVS